MFVRNKTSVAASYLKCVGLTPLLAHEWYHFFN